MSDITTGRLPDLITIGAMKCATSSLHRYLAEHSDVAVSTPKELDFFCEPKFSELGEQWYRQQFLDPPGATIALESSVNYTKAHMFAGVPERMHALLPDVKLLYILRDPLDRLESHWIHSVGAGKERRSFAEVIADPERADIVQTSRYWTQLEPFLAHYDPSQVKVLSFEAFSADPLAGTREVLDYVGLPTDWDHELIGKRIHPSRRKMRPNRLGMLVWEDQVRRRRVRKWLGRVVASPIPKPAWAPADRQRLIEYLRPDVDKIRDYSGLEFGEWSL